MKLKIFTLGGVMLLSLLQAGCQAEPTLTITLGGDVILGREDQAIFTGDPWGGLAPAELAADGSKDWFLVNLESPLGSNPGKKVDLTGYNLCAPIETADILKAGGVDLVSRANNHQGDCVKTAEPSRILPGIPQIFEEEPVFLEIPGGTVAIVAVDAVSKPLDMASLLVDIATLEEKSDLLIVSLHWGVEYAGEPTQLQREQAQQLANAGVDVLWGHHPHVLQPAEWIDSEDDSHRMLALYSLGNLLTDQTMTYETRQTALVQLEFKGGGISKVNFTPLVLTQKDGRLALSFPDENEENYFRERLGWVELMATFP